MEKKTDAGELEAKIVQIAWKLTYEGAQTMNGVQMRKLLDEVKTRGRSSLTVKNGVMLAKFVEVFSLKPLAPLAPLAPPAAPTPPAPGPAPSPTAPSPAAP
jgi:hypothetical protein